MTKANSRMISGATRVTGSGTKIGELEADCEGFSKKRGTTRVSTSTKLPGTNKVTPPLVVPLVNNGASMEKGLTRIVDSIGEQNEQISIRKSELERAVHVEREEVCDWIDWDWVDEALVNPEQREIPKNTDLSITSQYSSRESLAKINNPY